MVRHVALAVGDTAGHVLPALALADTYAQQAGPVAAHFLTAGEGTGHWLIRRAGYPLHVAPGSPFAGESRARQLLALGRIGLAVMWARRLLVRQQVRLVIGTGGYGSVAAVIAARSLGLRTAIIEPNVLPGLANRWLARTVHRAYVAFEEARESMPLDRALVTGLPVRRDGRLRATDKRAPELPRLRLLVVSGSRGARFLSEQIPAVVAALRRKGLLLEVRHQAGPHVETTAAAYAALGEPAEVVEFIDDISSALEWSDFAIARSGAGAMADVALAGIPTLFVPWVDAAHDHQAANAAALVRRGAALAIREDEWQTHVVSGRVYALMTDPARWTSMSRAVRTLAAHDAALQIVRDCEAMMQDRW